jgi:hypothetical protein
VSSFTSAGTAGGAAGAASSFFLAAFIALMIRNSTKAMIVKSMIDWTNLPTPSAEASVSATLTSLKSVVDHRRDDLSERAADHDADGHVDDVAAHRERLELRNHGHESPPDPPNNSWGIGTLSRRIGQTRDPFTNASTSLGVRARAIRHTAAESETSIDLNAGVRLRSANWPIGTSGLASGK